MNEADFDTLLHRTIKDGKEFESLIPYTTCERIGGGTGNTDYSISQIKKIAEKFNYQTEKIAKVLRGGSLEKDVAQIKDFLYDHFQYKADKNDQMMRAPSCSFFDRATGIDCKSYSIFASSLLINMGYIHYIRKIRQPAPNEWPTEQRKMFESGFSHVYVIVPVDQKNGSLTQGYYCIDGTIAIDTELNFIEAKDIIMNFPHHVLLGSVVQKDGYSYQDLPPLNGGISLSSLKDLSKSFKLDSISSIWDSIKCGSSAFTENESRVSLANIDKFYQEWSVRFNTAIQEDNTELTSALYAEFKGRSLAWTQASEKKVTQGYNSCTTKRIRANIAAFKFYGDVVGKVLDAYMAEYFDKVGGQFSQNATFSNEGSEAQPFGFHFTHTEPFFVNTQPKQMYVPDLKVNIPAFILPPYVINQINDKKPVDINTVLDLLETAGNIVKTVSPSTGTTKPGSFIKNPGVSIKPGVIKIPGAETSKKAGFGTVAVVGVSLLALAVAFSKMPNKPMATPRTNTRKTVKK